MGIRRARHTRFVVPLRLARPEKWTDRLCLGRWRGMRAGEAQRAVPAYAQVGPMANYSPRCVLVYRLRVALLARVRIREDFLTRVRVRVMRRVKF